MLHNFLDNPILLTELPEESDKYLVKGFQAASMPLDPQTFKFIYDKIDNGEYLQSQIIADIKDIEEASDIEDTEKVILIKSRIGHGALKKRLVQEECRCKICGLADERFLIASHIKPWRDSDAKERLDMDNVLLLCPHHDSAFDKGYIAFDEEGELLISDKLTLETKALLNLTERHKIKLRANNKKYIEWHRKNIFKP